MTAPDENPQAETMARAAQVLDFLGEAIPAWLERPDVSPPSPDAITGLWHICHWVAEDLRSAGTCV